jgi:hypothetical protein
LGGDAFRSFCTMSEAGGIVFKREFPSESPPLDPEVPGAE